MISSAGTCRRCGGSIRRSDVVLMVEVRGGDHLCPPSQAEDRLHPLRHAPFRRGAADARASRSTMCGSTMPATPAPSPARLERAVARHRPDRVVVTEPGEWRVLRMHARIGASASACPSSSAPTTASSAPRVEFARWAEGRKTFRMETFYRDMRERTGLLMDERRARRRPLELRRARTASPAAAAIAPPERLALRAGRGHPGGPRASSQRASPAISATSNGSAGR